MEIVIVFEGMDQTIFGMFGPFDNDEIARNWAEKEFPRHHWIVTTVSAPFGMEN